MDRKLEIYYPEDSMVSVFTKPRKRLKHDHARYFLSETLSLATDKDFSGNDLRVALSILSNLGYVNILNISQQTLSNQLSIDRSAVGKSIKKLISKGYLQVTHTVGRQNIYQFNPHIAFRSRAKNHKHLCHCWDEKKVADTRQLSTNLDIDLDADLEEKLDDKVKQLSQEFTVPASKVRQIILSLAKQTLEPEAQDETELPY